MQQGRLCLLYYLINNSNPINLMAQTIYCMVRVIFCLLGDVYEEEY